MGKNDPKPQEEVATEPVVTKPAEVLPTVAELAEKHGHSRPAPVLGDTPFSVPHLVADSINGWTRHKAYKSEEVRLSDADYLAAIDAGSDGKAHEPANKRPLTTFTKEQAEAKMAADLKATVAARAKPKSNKFNPGQAHQLVMHKARALAQSSGVKLKGGR